ncbi:hypothetical protein ATI61_102522 [Archangium gephyra]|uniref:Uncharacterized protein n=1 Tax=Archangium gephyra TaxID=48 RepID=A0AAC8TGS1_9BACT|nr:hypothetical protein [Archangium gephyra]AKJ05462.1 Hypothetical protein AA314_07088 [Archangium gephyra]REG36145.1 hypothetical protein ATI61_102522 [Archangium gephyra]
MSQAPAPLLQNRLDVHDRKQFEIKLEYQPSGADDETRYLVETYVFLPASLNIDAETYPRASFYADIHNYIRFKTPVMTLEELLSSDVAPLARLEAGLLTGLVSEAELVYQAKLLSCIFRGALRRFANGVDEQCEGMARGPSEGACARLESDARAVTAGARRVLERFRVWARSANRYRVQEKTRASIRLVDEYLSLTVEQFFRKAVADMDALPRSGVYIELRKDLMEEVLREEQYRKDHQLRSVISPTGDNEEYMHRFGFLKKFCMNILFLSARRAQRRQGWEEVLFALAAGVAMTFATAVAFWAQVRYTQASLNFFLIMVVGYMMKDRIKEGMRRIFSQVAARHLFDRTAHIVDPVTERSLGTCEEKVDYGRAVRVPEEVMALRFRDDFITATQGELSETVLRYQKQVVLDVDLLPRTERGVSGITDIIRLNVERFLRDMDEPEYALEYVDLEDFSVGRVRGAKSYQVDLAFRFFVQEAGQERVSLQLVRLVMDRNGIKRMLRLYPEQPPRPEQPMRSAA